MPLFKATLKGGNKFVDAIKRLCRRLGAGQGHPRTLEVGFLSNATYPDGKPVAMIAAIQNYGAPRANIPARPFFSNMVRDKSPSWGKTAAGLLKQNDYDVERTLEQMGLGIKGQLQQSIIDTNFPPLSPSTIKRKGFDKPLIETSHMINSADYRIN